MTPDEVRLLDNGKCILFIRPYFGTCGGFQREESAQKCRTSATPRTAARLIFTAADNALDDLPGAPENYELLDMDDFLPAEAALTIQRIRRHK